MPAETVCDHSYQFCGLVYHHAEWPLPGSGARQRYYEDKFFCTRCLDTKYLNKRAAENSYYKPIEGSSPK